MLPSTESSTQKAQNKQISAKHRQKSTGLDTSAHQADTGETITLGL